MRIVGTRGLNILIELYQPCTASVSKTRVCAYDGWRSSRLGGCTLTTPLFVGRKPTLLVCFGALPFSTDSERYGDSILVVGEVKEWRVRPLVDDNSTIAVLGGGARREVTHATAARWEAVLNVVRRCR